MSDLTLARPSNYFTASIARISFDGNRLRCYFPEKREDFRRVVKRHRLSWSNPYWIRELSNPQEKAVELIYDLVAAGFCVKADNALVQRAVDSNFEPEPTRIIKTTKEGWFRLWWGYGEDYYKAGMRLPGARYQSPSVVIPPDSFEEILDFASYFGFVLNEDAKQLVEQAREELESALIVSFDKPIKQTISKLVIPEVVEIDNDLLDD